MISCAEDVRVAYPLFQAGGGGSTPTSALQLVLERIPYETARDLNRLWHSRLPRITSPEAVMETYPHFGAIHDGLWYATGIWSNPVARLLPQREWLELRRMAVAPDAPRNTASRMLRIMALLIGLERPWVERLVSYQDTEVHAGTIYRAAGWDRVETKRDGNGWDCPSRPRRPSQSEAVKVRWEKKLAR